MNNVQELFGLVGFLDDRAKLGRELFMRSRTTCGAPVSVHSPGRAHKLILETPGLKLIRHGADEIYDRDSERVRARFHLLSPLIHGEREVHAPFRFKTLGISPSD